MTTTPTTPRIETVTRPRTVERLIAGDRQYAKPDLLGFEAGNDMKQIGDRPRKSVDPTYGEESPSRT